MLSRNYSYTGTETPKIFSRVVAKILKELSTPTLNGIVVSTWCVSSAPVIRDAGLNDQLRHMQLNKTRKAEDCDAFSEVGHNYDNPVASLDYAYIHKSILYVRT